MLRFFNWTVGDWLVVTGAWLLFFHILGISSSQLTFICFRGGETTNQLKIEAPFLKMMRFCHWTLATVCNWNMFKSDEQFVERLKQSNKMMRHLLRDFHTLYFLEIHWKSIGRKWYNLTEDGWWMIPGTSAMRCHVISHSYRADVQQLSRKSGPSFHVQNTENTEHNNKQNITPINKHYI